MTIHIREAAEADLPAIARIGTAAFHPSTDAISRHIFPAHLKPEGNADIGDAAYPWRLARKSAGMRAFEGLKDGSKVMVAVDENEEGGQVVGFSWWEAPETGAGDKELEGLKHWFPDPAPEGVDQAAFLELREVVDGDAKAVIGGQESKTWNLDYLGVDPRQQRRGIGRKLLHAGFEYVASRAAADGDVAHNVYLVATPAGRGLYESVGFNIINELSIFGHTHHSMLRRVEAATERLLN